MEKIIWVIDNNKNDLINIQRKINTLGGIRSMSIVSEFALQKIIEERLVKEDFLSYPSLILISYHMLETEKGILKMLKGQPKLAGIPLFFMVDNGEDTDKEVYYSEGAMIVLEKPVNSNGILRMRQAAEQYEITKSYERILQKQLSELAIAKQIQSLNVQLENRNKFLCRVFGKYFSDDVLEVILANQEEIALGDRRDIAVLMCDLRGFSAKSEELRPDELLLLLNRFFGAMVEVIAKYNGTVIEFMGDAILAIFGAPMSNEMYVESAVAAAISMQNAIKEINHFCSERGIFELEMGVGVHCGEAFVGNVGTEKMMRYNVIGRVVNECSRIESCSIGGQVLISDKILDRLSCDVTIENHISVEAKGIRQPLQIYEISSIRGDYLCSLEKSEEVLYPLAESVCLELYPIRDKVISNIPIEAVLKFVNAHSAVVEPVEEVQQDISVCSDVEVRTKCGDIAQFLGVYAKIVQINEKEIRLRFTHSNKEFETFVAQLKLEKELLMIKYEKNGRYGIKIEQVPLEKFKETDDVEKESHLCNLFWAEQNKDILLSFYSSIKEVQALEFMDYLVHNYVIVQGNAQKAQAVLDAVFVQAMLMEFEENTIEGLLEKITECYYTNCDSVYAVEFAEKNRDMILNMPSYTKKRKPWAYVKTTDILQTGEKFYLKSLENQSRILIEASEDIYIMIGQHGEIYHIDREKFEKTYEASEEYLDIFEKILNYMPEIQRYDDSEFISLDEIAHLCYPKTSEGIYVTPLNCRTKVFNPYNKGQYFLGHEGDYLAIRKDDLQDIYIIQKDIFRASYEECK